MDGGRCDAAGREVEEEEVIPAAAAGPEREGCFRRERRRKGKQTQPPFTAGTACLWVW